VAVRAGVSVATVSRALAGNYPTSAAARAKVLRAVKDLDYVIDGRARALAGTGPKTVAVVMTSVDSPFFAAVAQGVEQEPPSAYAPARCVLTTITGMSGLGAGRPHSTSRSPPLPDPARTPSAAPGRLVLDGAATRITISARCSASSAPAPARAPRHAVTAHHAQPAALGGLLLHALGDGREEGAVHDVMTTATVLGPVPASARARPSMT